MKAMILVLLGVLAVAWTGCGGGSEPQPPAAKPAVQQPLAPEPAAPQREKAAESGAKGRDYGEGMVATPLKSFWGAKKRLALDQIEQAMQLYKATDPEGRGPKSHEDFMEKIIRANRIRLPELPAGERYIYDPEKGELMIERPESRQ